MTLDAYHLAAVGTRAEILRAAAAARPASWERRLLDAVAAQYGGDVDGAIGMLRRLVRNAAPGPAAAAADFLAPILVMRRQSAEVAQLAERLADAGWRGPASAFRGLDAARRGDRPAARRHARRAAAAIEGEADVVVVMRVLQRLALIAYLLDDYGAAVDHAMRSARIAERLGAWRAAIGGYSIAYNVHHDVTGEVDEADRYIALWRQAAEKCDDLSLLHTALVGEFAIAVQTGDDERADALRRRIAKQRLPQQYTEHFGLTLSHAMIEGRTSPAAMRTLIQVARDTPGRSRGESAFCTALIALASAALREDDTAREELRAAIARLGRPRPGSPAHERWYRRSARIVVAVTCDLLGDHVRAARLRAARELDVADGAPDWRGDSGDVPRPYRGAARVIEAMRGRRAADAPSAGLTVSEMEVLRLLGHGWSAGRIARETHRSVNTVYNHTRAILAKLDADRAAEAVAIARRIGLLA